MKIVWENNNGETIDLQIIGSGEQICKIQKTLSAIKEKAKLAPSGNRISISLPKLYIRKILGYQNKHK